MTGTSQFDKKKTDFDSNLSSLNRKITANKSINLLVENELKKLKKKLIQVILLAKVILKKMVPKIN